ncbi:hypothetical protein, partial [Escherichia coli]|uniref:hypothetical protein n=1 Tax=Escherichia coli TaxID=562 RepID=UPI001C591904
MAYYHNPTILLKFGPLLQHDHLFHRPRNLQRCKKIHGPKKIPAPWNFEEEEKEEEEGEFKDGQRSRRRRLLP